MNGQLSRAVACVLLLSGVVAAQTGPAGPVHIGNKTGKEVLLTNVRYTDADGKVVKVDGGWKLAAGFSGYLAVRDEKFSARQIEFDFTTDDGKTTGWKRVSSKLDDDGDFATVFSVADLARHRKALGVKVAAIEPDADDGVAARLREQQNRERQPREADRAEARQEAERLTESLRVANNKLLAARLAVGVAQTAYNRAETTGGEIAAGLALQLARQACSEMESEVSSLNSALRSANLRASAPSSYR